jgi:hypothetical protein
MNSFSSDMWHEEAYPFLEIATELRRFSGIKNRGIMQLLLQN